MTALERTVLRIAVFLSGAMLMAAEIVAFRIVGKTFGSALRETTAVIAVFLTAMSIGYWAGGRIGDRRPRPSTIIAALMSAAVTLMVIPWLDASISPWIATSAINLSMHALAATTLLFALPTALFSTVSPIAIRLFATSAAESGSTAGSISAISTAGSIAGSLATAFFLLDWLASINRTVIAVALLAAATSLAILLASARGVARSNAPLLRRYAFGAAVAVTLLIATTAFVRSTTLDRSLLTSAREWKVLFTGDSAYHHILVRERIGRYREMTFGIGIQSRMIVGKPAGPGVPYTDALHIARLFRPGIRRVLLIGLGGGTFPKQVTAYYPDTTIDVVDVDPMVVDVAKRYFDVQENDRVRIHIADGRTFLRRSNDKWDLIIIDAYTENRYGRTVPPHLVTQEFFTEVAKHLNEGGVVHFHCFASGSKLLAALEQTIGSVFHSVLVTDGEIVASEVPLLTGNDVIVQRARQSATAALPHLPQYIADLHPAEPPADALLLRDDYAPVDTLLHPH